MRSELQRLRIQAERRGLCPTHGTRPWCAFCDMTWTGTEAELHEAGDLVRRMRGDEPPLPKVRCRCGQDALCVACTEAYDRRHPAPPSLLSPEEQARYQVLLTKLVRKGGRAGGTPRPEPD